MNTHLLHCHQQSQSFADRSHPTSVNGMLNKLIVIPLKEIVSIDEWAYTDFIENSQILWGYVLYKWYVLGHRLKADRLWSASSLPKWMWFPIDPRVVVFTVGYPIIHSFGRVHAAHTDENFLEFLDSLQPHLFDPATTSPSASRPTQ